MENKTFERDGLQVQVEWMPDEYPDLSWMGTYTNDEGEYRIDRQAGLVLGAELPEPGPIDNSEHTDEEISVLEEQYDDWLKQPYQVLGTVRPRQGGWYELQYFVPENHLSSNWGHVSDNDMASSLAHQVDELARFDIEVPENPTREHMICMLGTLYACQDYTRLEDYGHRWVSMICVVTLSSNGVEITRDSLGGIESDCDDDWANEVEEDCLSKALWDARRSAQRFQEIVYTLRGMTNDDDRR